MHYLGNPQHKPINQVITLIVDRLAGYQPTESIFTRVLVCKRLTGATIFTAVKLTTFSTAVSWTYSSICSNKWEEKHSTTKA